MGFISLLLMPFLAIGGFFYNIYNVTVTTIFAHGMKSDITAEERDDAWNRMPLVLDADGAQGEMNEIELLIREYMEKAAEAINDVDDEALTELYGKEYLDCDIKDDSSDNPILTSQAEGFIVDDIGRIVSCKALEEKCTSKKSRSDPGDFAGIYMITGDSGDSGYCIIKIEDNRLKEISYILGPYFDEDKVSLETGTYMNRDVSVFLTDDFEGEGGNAEKG